MTAVTLPLIPTAGETIIHTGVPWEAYLHALGEIVDRPGLRVSYGDGRLQIMSVGFEHERINRALASIVDIAADALRLDWEAAGSTTFRLDHLRKGFEPDSSFYFGTNASRIRGKAEIDLEVDPPPALVVEVDIHSPSLSRIPLFEAAGVREVWRYRHGFVEFHVLEAGRYRLASESACLPGLTAQAVTELLDAKSAMSATDWRKLAATKLR